MILSDEQLEEIENRANAATGGPWKIVEESRKYFMNDLLYGEGDFDKESNLNFIAEARTDIPNLIETIKELKKENEALKRPWIAVFDEFQGINIRLRNHYDKLDFILSKL